MSGLEDNFLTNAFGKGILDQMQVGLAQHVREAFD